MPRITKEEIIKLSKISHIEIYEHEINALALELEAVLNYAACLDTIADKNNGQPVPKNSNIMREDTIYPSSADKILAQAPATEEHYFVVPAILKQQD
jgi:aspartyl/glutamyl-tRNA(Asn/Gln) amidotransferase C subunit